MTFGSRSPPRTQASVRALSANGTPALSAAATAASTAFTDSASGLSWSSRFAPTMPTSMARAIVPPASP
jgi:hypothetical protein